MTDGYVCVILEVIQYSEVTWILSHQPIFVKVSMRVYNFTIQNHIVFEINPIKNKGMG